MDFVIFIAAMAALIKGADFIIEEAEKIAIYKNIPKYIIGASIVAFGTSSPELAASISSSYKGLNEMAVANVVGSNIFNIALILGLSFLIAKNITPKRDIFAKDSAWSLIPLVAYILMIFDGVITRFEGLIFIALAVAYVIFLINSAKSGDDSLADEIDEEALKADFSWTKVTALLLLGFVMLVAGADFAVNSASNIARSFGVSEWIIGMFLVGFGTSLPEVIVSVKAALKNSADIAVGNVIGSNIANFTLVLGSASVVSPLVVDVQKNMFDNLAMAFLTILLIFMTANKLYGKSSGVALLAIFALIVVNLLNTVAM